MSGDEVKEGMRVVCNTLLSPEMTDRYKAVLPKEVSLQKFTRVVVTALQMNPALLNCNRTSFYNATVRAAQDGLMPDGREGAIIEFNRKGPGGNWEKAAQWMPMRAGLIKRMATAGIRVDSHVVREGDQFSYILGDNPRIDHVPKFGVEETPIIAAYAIATLADGSKVREVLSRSDIDSIRGASRAKDSGPWVSWFSEMARKSAIKRLYKNLPITDDSIGAFIARDDSDFSEPAVTLPEPEAPAEVLPEPAPPPKKQTRARALQAVIDADSQESPNATTVEGGEPDEGVF